MESTVTGIFCISGVCLIILAFYKSVMRTKSAAQWMKGYNLKSNMTDDSVLEILKRMKYPQKENVFTDSEGKSVLKTKYYQYPVDISRDENGNTIVGFLVNWGKVSKYKRKKVAMDLDNVYSFLKQEVEGADSYDALKIYEKNQKVQMLYNIASVVCILSFVAFALLILF